MIICFKFFKSMQMWCEGAAGPPIPAGSTPVLSEFIVFKHMKHFTVWP